MLNKVLELGNRAFDVMELTEQCLKVLVVADVTFLPYLDLQGLSKFFLAFPEYVFRPEWFVESFRHPKITPRGRHLKLTNAFGEITMQHFLKAAHLIIHSHTVARMHATTVYCYIRLQVLGQFVPGQLTPDKLVQLYNFTLVANWSRTN